MWPTATRSLHKHIERNIVKLDCTVVVGWWHYHQAIDFWLCSIPKIGMAQEAETVESLFLNLQNPYLNTDTLQVLVQHSTIWTTVSLTSMPALSFLEANWANILWLMSLKNAFDNEMNYYLIEASNVSLTLRIFCVGKLGAGEGAHPGAKVSVWCMMVYKGPRGSKKSPTLNKWAHKTTWEIVYSLHLVSPIHLGKFVKDLSRILLM